LNPTHPCRAILAEDHVFVRELIVHLAEMSSTFRIISQEKTLSAALNACQTSKADLLLLSIALLREGEKDAKQLLTNLQAKHAILVYCNSCTTQSEIVRAIRFGINGCVGIDSDVEEFLDAIRHVCRGETYFCSSCTKILADVALSGRNRPRESRDLSFRELEVLQMICDGRTSKQIARTLGLSLATINTHRRNLMAKADAHNAADLIRYGRKHNLLEFRSH
jgi:two-component system, NarL family, response regulator DegU